MQHLDFQRLFEALPSGHMLLDRDFRYVAVNPAYERVTMRTRDELVGNLLFDVFPNEGEGGRRLRASFERVFETGEADTLAYIPYDIPRPEALGGGIEQRYWTAVHVPVTDAGGEVEFLLQNTVDVTDFVRLREAASLPFRSRPGESALIERAREAEQAHREAEQAHREALDDSEEFRRLFQQAPGFFAVLTGPDHVFTFVNDAYSRLVGGRNVIGMAVREALPEIEGQGFFEFLDAVYRDGVQRGGEGARVMLRQAPGEAPRETFLDFSYAAVRDQSGAVSGIFVQGMDRTEAFRVQQRQRLLLDELNHRVKNTLATVQSIAAQTFRKPANADAARASFEGRLVALSKAHNLLSDRQWTNADLQTIVDQELAPFGGSRRTVHGPAVALNAKAAIALAMVFHELTANAAKHGALSAAEGSVSVTWTISHEGEAAFLVVDWAERDGPPPHATPREGFGARMIHRAVTGELAGEFNCDYAAGGFSCQIKVPLDAVTRPDHAFV